MATNCEVFDLTLERIELKSIAFVTSSSLSSLADWLKRNHLTLLTLFCIQPRKKFRYNNKKFSALKMVEKHKFCLPFYYDSRYNVM